VCGILAYAGFRDGRAVIREGLSRLEYRGYDSAGLAVNTDEGLAVEKTDGRVDDLDVDALPAGEHGIGHTRWATHGPPTVENAHPHVSCQGDVAIVHNGIVTNAGALRDELAGRGHAFRSDTDTEVIVHLVEEAYQAHGDLADAVREAEPRLEGSYAFVALHRDHPDELVATRHESPLVLGVGDDECFVASDVVAFLEHTDRAVFLHDDDLLHVRGGEWRVDPADGRKVAPETVPWDVDEATRAGYPHYMLKEIHEQPQALRQALVGRTDPGRFELKGRLGLDALSEASEVHLLACGSSHNASRVARPIMEHCLDVPVIPHVSSEFDAQRVVTGSDPLFVAVSQSGETADTLEAVRTVRALGHEVLAVTNVVGSTITREASCWTPIRAGPELSVAATKSFTGQTLVLGLLAAHLAEVRGHSKACNDLMEGLRRVPHAVQSLLDEAERYRRLGEPIADRDHCFVLGQGAYLAAAQETALKVKEISYVHAEAFPMGELKHGPLALVEEGTPAIVKAPAGGDRERASAAMSEVEARGGRVLALTDDADAMEQTGVEAIEVPGGAFPAPLFAMTVAGQLIAYETAVQRGCDVDKPRNLAKSVTVK
jgi:glucosamine--fructose-6-phosphate aminotransferase (isomerizing)